MGESNHHRHTASIPKSQADQPGSTRVSEEIEVAEVDPEEVIKTSAGELMHEPTGIIIDEKQIDHGPEWRSFTQTERDKKSRVGSPMTEQLHDRGLTTTISWQNQDVNGRYLTSQKRNQMNRLRKWQQRIRIQDATERNLKHALGEINRMASALGIPESTREIASVIYRQALSEKLLPGRSIEGVATAVIYAACRQEKIPRSLTEITPVSRVDRKEISRTHQYISRELNLEIEPVDPKQYLPRFASKLNASAEIQKKAKEVIEVSAKEGLLSGRSPTGFAAAAIYTASLLCNGDITQQNVVDVANVTEVTIRNRYQEQIEIMD